MCHQLHTLTLFYRVHYLFLTWELSGDLLDDGSTPLLDAANKKLADPSINCADMGVGAIATYDEAAGTTDEEAVETTKFYPHFDSSTCLSDGLQPSWLQASEIYDTVEDCCRNSFIWNTNCVAQSTPIEGVVFYPASGTYACKSDGKQPPYMSESDLFSNKEDCCEYHFSWVLADCLSGEATTTTTSTTTTTTRTTTTTTRTTTTKSTDNAGTSATTTTKATAGQVESTKATTTKATTTKATAYQQVQDGQSPMFFPVFESGLTTCRSQIDGTPASWLSVKDFKSTVSDCCRSYASNYDDCVTASYAAVRYYPDFRTMSCVSEEAGTPEDWIAGDYFLWNEKRCCKAFFASAESSSCKNLL